MSAITKWHGRAQAVAPSGRLAARPSTRVSQYLRHATLGLLLFGIIAPGSFAFLILRAPFAWLIAYLLAKSASGPPRPTTAVQTGGIAPTIGVAPVPPPGVTPAVGAERLHRRKIALLAIVLSFTIVSLAGRMIYVRHLETTSLMFIGIPTMLAILFVFSVRPESAMGTAMTGITFALLLSAMVFGEGTICILMAAPIFYIVGAIIASVSR